MLYSEQIAFQIKHTNTPHGQNVELLKVKTGGTQTNHYALKVSLTQRGGCVLK